MTDHHSPIASRLAAAYIDHIKDREWKGVHRKGWANPVVTPGLLQFAVNRAYDAKKPETLAVLARLICPLTPLDSRDAFCGSGYGFDAASALQEIAATAESQEPDYEALQKICARRDRKMEEFTRNTMPMLPRVRYGSEQMAGDAEITAACAAMPDRPASRAFALTEQMLRA